MGERSFSYCIIQFSPRPDRFEYLNVGVIVFDFQAHISRRKLSHDFSRVKKLFGNVSSSFIGSALEDFAERVDYEFLRKSKTVSAEDFNSKRVGLFKITSLQPVFGQSSSLTAAQLYADLVEAKIKHKRAKKVSVRLKEEFGRQGVLPLLSAKPEPVKIDKWGISIRADFGYQNGVFNLIEAARFDESERGLEAAGKRVLEGKALAETFDHRLIVVGEFGDQSDAYIENLKGEFAIANSKLYTLDEVDQLAFEIRRSAH